MPQLPSKLYRIYIKHSLPFINLHTLSYFIQKQTIATSSQHFAYSPRVKHVGTEISFVISYATVYLTYFLVSLSLSHSYPSIDRNSPEWQWALLWFGGEGNLVQCQEFHLNQPRGPCYPFRPKKLPQNLPFVSWLHLQQSSVTGRPDSQGSAIGLSQASPRPLPKAGFSTTLPRLLITWFATLSLQHRLFTTDSPRLLDKTSCSKNVPRLAPRITPRVLLNPWFRASRFNVNKCPTRCSYM